MPGENVLFNLMGVDLPGMFRNSHQFLEPSPRVGIEGERSVWALSSHKVASDFVTKVLGDFSRRPSSS